MNVHASWCEYSLLQHLVRSLSLCATTPGRVGFVQTHHLRQIQFQRRQNTHNVACVEIVRLHTFDLQICHALVVKALMRSIVSMKVNDRLGQLDRRIAVGGATVVHQHKQGQCHLRAPYVVVAIRQLVDVAMTKWLVSMPELRIINQQAPQVRCKQTMCIQTRIDATHMCLGCAVLNHYEIRDRYRHLPTGLRIVIDVLAQKIKHLFSRIDAVNYIETREYAGVALLAQNGRLSSYPNISNRSRWCYRRYRSTPS